MVLVGKVLVAGLMEPNGTSGWLLNFIRLLHFASSNEEIGEIMLLLVDLVFFAPLSEILFDRTLL